MPMLTPWPLKDQLNDWTLDDGGMNPNAENNCGPASVAMCVKYLTGLDLPSDFIKDVLYGENFLGYTFMNHLANFMQERAATRCELHSGDAHTLLQPIVRRSIDQGFPVIVLYFWRLEEPQSGHFAPVIGYDEGGCTRANPWGGKLEYWGWPMFEEWQKLGNCIVIQRKRDPQLDSESRDFIFDNPMINGVRDLQVEAAPYFDRLRK